MKKLRYIIAFSLFVLGGSGAELRAQTPPNPPATSWYPPPSVQPPTLAVTNASARVALPAAPTVYPVVTVVNVGAQEIFCRLGDATVTVTTASYEFAIPGNNGYRAVWDASSAYVACITASSTSTARITQSNGGPTLGFNGAPASLPPSGAAGGDLAGTYPNPSVVSYNGGTVFGTAAAANTGTSGATVPLLNGVNTWSAAQTVSVNGAVSLPSTTFTGTVFTGGTATTTVPQFLFQPAGTTAVTSWSTSGTVMGFNLTNGFGGRLFDLHVANGSSIFTVSGSTGAIFDAGNISSNGSFIASGSLSTIRLKNYTVSGLSSITAVQGDTVFVTDAAACTFGLTPAGSSNTICPVFYNGSAWVAG